MIKYFYTWLNHEGLELDGSKDKGKNYELSPFGHILQELSKTYQKKFGVAVMMHY